MYSIAQQISICVRLQHANSIKWETQAIKYAVSETVGARHSRCWLTLHYSPRYTIATSKNRLKHWTFHDFYSLLSNIFRHMPARRNRLNQKRYSFFEFCPFALIFSINKGIRPIEHCNSWFGSIKFWFRSDHFNVYFLFLQKKFLSRNGRRLKSLLNGRTIMKALFKFGS